MSETAEPKAVADEVAAQGAPAARPPRFAALSVRTFRWYWMAHAVSITGDGMENILRNWLVWEITRSPFWLGMMVFAHWVPYTIFSLWGGVLADRYDNRKVQLVAQVLLTAAAVGVAVSVLAGFVTEWWIFGFLLLHGFAGAIGQPAQQTLIHNMVGPSRLLSAVSLNSSTRQLSQVVGPVVGGFLLITFGAGLGFLVNALTFIPLLLLLLVIRVPRLGGPVQRQGTVEAFRESVGFIRSKPTISSIIAIEMVPVIFIGHAFQSLLPVFVTDVLHVNELGYAFLLAGSGAGALGAAIFLAYASEIRRKGLVIAVAAMVEMVAIFLFALSTHYLLSLLLLVGVGAATVIGQAVGNTTIQLAAPDRIRGRVMGAYTFGTQGMRVVNGPLLGALAVAVGTPLAVAGSAAFVFAALGAILLKVPQLRRID
ncbi:MAG TPA: MFS transporter [Candidatus Limnocylindrales bacterium]|nr:MFS transporter [Candidatus Limnocylindrales bacterium]